ncbi:hypothetical protein N665_0470s0024 [Sinapis alba]|nr:hypothetical protein N665_0470s0024 [Sinapis alba]
MSDIKIQGYNIHKNTMLQINTYTIGRDSNCWKNPNKFIPKRFIVNLIDCNAIWWRQYDLSGMVTEMTILELGLLSVLYFFDWSLPDGMIIEDIDMERSWSFRHCQESRA